MTYIQSPRYDILLTPKLPATQHDDAAFDVHETTQALPPLSKPRFVWYLAHGVIGCCMLFAIAASIQFHSTWYRTGFYTTAIVWWGGDPTVRSTGRFEMVQPTYFLLGLVLPIASAALLFPFVQRHVPTVATPLSKWLHTKPKTLLHLVSYGELLFLAALAAGNALVGYYQYAKRTTPTTATSDAIKNGGISLGYVSMFNLTFLALPATRQSFWMAYLNIPYANGLKYHRWIGVATVATLTTHVGIIIAYYVTIDSVGTLLPCWECDLASAEGMDSWQNFFGLVAFICVGIMALASLPYVRRNHYEVFRTAHFLALPVAILGSMHQVPVLYSVFASMVLYLVNRMYSRATTCAPVSVAAATAMPADVVELTFHCTTDYAPGGTVWVRVPALSQTQWHPFSIASSPLQTPGLLTIYVKCLGNWTTGLYHYIQECKRKRLPPLVYLDGGSVFNSSISLAHRHVVFVAGGIGITVLMGKITHTMLTTPNQVVWLVWHVRQSEMLLQFHDWLRDLESLAAKSGSQLHIHLHVTRDPLAVFNVSGDHKGIVPCFDVHAKPVAVTPFAHMSFAPRMWMLLVAFFCSGGLLALAVYDNAIQTHRRNYWPLQRFVAFCAVVGGCGVAYLAVTLATMAAKASQRASVDMPTLEAKPTTDTVMFLVHYNVQTVRVNWAVLLSDIQSHVGPRESVGVYVSGPKPLIRDVDSHFQHHPRFHVYHHQFLV